MQVDHLHIAAVPGRCRGQEGAKKPAVRSCQRQAKIDFGLPLAVQNGPAAMLRQPDISPACKRAASAFAQNLKLKRPSTASTFSRLELVTINEPLPAGAVKSWKSRS